VGYVFEAQLDRLLVTQVFPNRRQHALYCSTPFGNSGRGAVEIKDTHSAKPRLNQDIRWIPGEAAACYAHLHDVDTLGYRTQY